MNRLIVIAALACAPCLAQTAKVIQLSPNEAQEALRISKQLEAAKAEDSAFRQKIKDKYIQDQRTNVFRGSWPGADFEYSEDFKFIVPVAPRYATPYGLGGCTTFVGATVN